MLRLVATREVTALDPADLLRYVPALLSALRSIEFDGCVCVDPDGVRREGLRLVAGVAGRAGATYQLAQAVAAATPSLTRAETEELRREVRSAQAAGSDRKSAIREFTRRRRERLAAEGHTRRLKYYDIEVQQDDSHLLAIAVTDHDLGITANITVDHPDHPSRLRVEVSGVLTGNWFQRGPLIATGHLDLDHLPPAQSHDPQLEGRVRLRRWRGDGHLRITEDHNHWILDLLVRVGGRGVLRPAVALAGVLAGPRLRRTFAERVAQSPDGLADLKSELDRLRSGGAGTAAQEAEKSVAMQLRRLPEHVPRAAGQ